MTTDLPIPGFDGLMTLSRREGIDIRPTLLRVLTDLYVQSGNHSADEESQFVELASRLIDEVDDATRAAVRARLAIYPRTPSAIRDKLQLNAVSRAVAPPLVPQAPQAELAAPSIQTVAAAPPIQPSPPIQRSDALLTHEHFFTLGPQERVAMIASLDGSAHKQAGRSDARRRARSIAALEMAAFVSDRDNFIREVGDALLLPQQFAERIVGDAGGEPLACAMKALGMPPETFQRVLLFLDPAVGSSVMAVFRLARLYDAITERAALTMLGIWRSASAPAKRNAQHRPALYDDERQRARPTFGQVRTAQPRSLQSEKSVRR